MKLKIYHNPRCSKSRQTLQILEDSAVDFQIIEYLKEVPTEAELRRLIEELNIEAIDLIRKGESIYKEHFKGKNLTNEEWISAMVQNPKLIERPIVSNGRIAVIGRPPEKVLELI
ncbi:MAG: arsenate reductase [Salibacteraceae bacterium]|jgi:arsenate reductase